MAKLENRYVVLKVEDLERLDEYQRNALKVLLARVEISRREAGKPPSQEYVVIGKDWPEYEIVVGTLLKRLEREELEDRLMSLTDRWLTSPRYQGEFMLIGTKGCFQIIARFHPQGISGISPLNEEWKVILTEAVVRDKDGC